MQPRDRAILLIGGLDPTGQAGLARDLAECHKERLVGCPVAAGLTAQTSAAFHAANAVDPAILAAQAEAALAEHDIAWAKVGALFSAQQVEQAARIVEGHRLGLVLDPVLASSSGVPFLDGAGRQALLQRLLPLALLVTPNRDEACQLTGLDDAPAAAARLVELGAGAALVTQGGAGPDVLAEGGRTHAFLPETRPGRHRGTGCRLASRSAALLARGLPVAEAVAAAHRELQWELGLEAGRQGLDPARLRHLRELEEWLPRIVAELRHGHLPEVGINVAYALPGARGPDDVVGLAGRITIAGWHREVAGRLAFGGPHHTGRIAVALQGHDPSVRIVMNHRHDPAFLENAGRAGLVAMGFRREDEPADAPSTMEWGLRDAIRRNEGKVPDVMWDAGGPGKEAMIRILARDPADLLLKLRALHP